MFRLAARVNPTASKLRCSSAVAAAGVASTITTSPIISQTQRFQTGVGAAASAEGAAAAPAGVVAPPPGMQPPSSSSADGGVMTDDIDFFKYPAINVLKDTNFEVCAKDGAEWILTEKVHGSNFAIYLLASEDGERFKIRYGKRNGFLLRDGETNRAGKPGPEDFFGYQCLEPVFEKQIFQVRKLLLEHLAQKRREENEKITAKNKEQKQQRPLLPDITNIYAVVLQGELFGAHYHHPNLPKENTQRYFFTKEAERAGGPSRPVKGPQVDAFPQYGKELNLFAIDIAYKLNSPHDEPLTLPYDDACAIFEKITDPKPILYSKPLMRGPLEKMLAFNTEIMETTLPLQLGYGDHYLRNNFAEGVIVRRADRGTAAQPVREGSSDILKWKAEAFQELRHKDRKEERKGLPAPTSRAYQRMVQKHGPQLPLMSAVFPTKEAVKQCEHLIAHVCSTRRLKGLMSKIGPDVLQTAATQEESDRMRTKLAYLLAQDALKDFLKDLSNNTTTSGAGSGEESSSLSTSVLCAPLMQRREFVRYALFEANKFVAEKWKHLTNPDGISLEEE